jgi:DNA-binding YbaB/EbfC family protein
MTDGMNMADMFGKIADMQKKMAETQENLGSKSVTAEAGGGMVKVTANGLQRVTSISIEKEVVDPRMSNYLKTWSWLASTRRSKKHLAWPSRKWPRPQAD